MTAKLRIKTKGIEIEWEGEVEFLKSEVPDLIASIIQAIGSGIGETEEDASGSDSEIGKRAPGQFTTAAAAAKLQARSGAELFKAALLKLQASDRVEPAARGRILDEMKLAPRAYKPSMSKNLSNIINGLLDQGEINEPSSGQFVLSHNAYDDLSRRFNT